MGLFVKIFEHIKKMSNVVWSCVSYLGGTHPPRELYFTDLFKLKVSNNN